MISINDLDAVTPKAAKTDIVDSILYLFWDKGISLKELEELPMPYIIKIMNYHSKVKKEEERAYKKASRK